MSTMLKSGKIRLNDYTNKLDIYRNLLKLPIDFKSLLLIQMMSAPYV